MAARATVHDIARQAQVNVNEVVKVMLQQQGVDRMVRDRILTAMHELAFPLIPNYSQTTQQALGVIAPTNFNGEYMGAVLGAVTQMAQQAKVGIRFNIQSDSVRENLSLLLNDPHIFGILLVSPMYYRETLSVCRQYQIPVATYSYQDNEDLSDVLVLQVNNRQSIINAVDYLVNLNHRRIGFITGYMTHSDAFERFEGYQLGLAKHFIPFDERLVAYGDFLRESGYSGAQSLLRQQNRPSAIIASSDMMAIGVMQAAQEMGLQVGKALAIIGFDDIPIASQISPALTTLAQPYLALATAAVEGLQKMAQGERLADYQPRFEADFILRDSVMALP